MVRFTRGRLELLAEKFADLANLAVAGLVFGQAVGQETFSPAVGFAGYWDLVGVSGSCLCDQRRPSMTTALFMLTGILVIAGIITLLAWLSQRRDRRPEHHRSA